MTLALALGGACSNSDANSGDTEPRNSGGDGARTDAPGGQPGGSDPVGEGTGTGRGD